MATVEKDEKDSRWGWLLTTAKIVGAVATIGGVIIAVCSWIFTVAMSDRDNKIQDLQASIDTLNESVLHLSAQLDDSEERFTNLRIAMELLNARLELRTAPATAPPPPVRVRVRPRSSAVVVPTAALTEHEAINGSDMSSPPPSLGYPLIPPRPEERVFHSDREAEEAFDQALVDIGGET